MTIIITGVNYLIGHYQQIVTALTGFLTGLIGICMLFKGPEPQATLQKIVDFITKYSRK